MPLLLLLRNALVKEAPLYDTFISLTLPALGLMSTQHPHTTATQLFTNMLNHIYVVDSLNFSLLILTLKLS